MKKILMLILFVLEISANDLYCQYSGGTGTQADPFLISNLNDLIELTVNPTHWDKYFLQIESIDATSTNTLNAGKGLIPIGNTTQNFTGVYDGNNKTISNLFIDRADENNMGLFGYIGTTGIIKNLGLENSYVCGYSYVGILCGQNLGTISGCHTSGSVYAKATDYGRCGGLIGRCTGKVSKCYSSANVYSDKDIAGGLIGQHLLNELTDSYSTGDVVGTRSVGGLVGYSTGNIKNCYSVGKVSGTDRVGGFIGNAYTTSNSSITNCYSMGNVLSSDGYAGGFVGLVNADNVRILNCYSTGSLNTGSSYMGGFAGKINVPENISNSFWDTDNSGYTTSDGGIGKSTAEMNNISTFLAAGWDFKCETNNGTLDLWGQNSTDNSKYPFLAWQGYRTDFNPPVITSTPASQILSANEDCQAILPDYTSLVDFSDDCTPLESLIVTQEPIVGTLISGDQNVTIRVTDRENNFSEVNFLVTFVDQIQPSITCPGDKTIEILSTQNMYTINGTEFDLINFSDNCEIQTISNSLNGLSSLNGYELALGSHSISWNVSDKSGNISVCTFNVTINKTSGVITNTDGNETAIFPNPSQNIIFIEFANEKNHRIQLISVTGEVLLEIKSTTSRVSVDISKLKKGVYFVSVDSHISSKIIKE